MKLKIDCHFRINKVSPLCEQELDHSLLNPQHASKHILPESINELTELRPLTVSNPTSYFKNEKECTYLIQLIEQNSEINLVIERALKRFVGDFRIRFDINASLALPEVNQRGMLCAMYNPLANQYEWGQIQYISLILDFPSSVQSDQHHLATVQTIFPLDPKIAPPSMALKLFSGELINAAYTEQFSHHAPHSLVRRTNDLVITPIASHSQYNIFAHRRSDPRLVLSEKSIGLSDTLVQILAINKSQLKEIEDKIKGLETKLDLQIEKAHDHNLSGRAGLFSSGQSIIHRVWLDRIQAQYNEFANQESTYLSSVWSPNQHMALANGLASMLDELRRLFIESRIEHARDLFIQNDGDFVSFVQRVIEHLKTKTSTPQTYQFNDLTFVLGNHEPAFVKIAKKMQDYLKDKKNYRMIKDQLAAFIVEPDVCASRTACKDLCASIEERSNIYKEISKNGQELSKQEEQQQSLYNLLEFIKPELPHAPNPKDALNALEQSIAASEHDFLKVHYLSEYIKDYKKDYKITELFDLNFTNIYLANRAAISKQVHELIKALITYQGMGHVLEFNARTLCTQCPHFFTLCDGVLCLSDDFFGLYNDYNDFCILIDETELLIRYVNSVSVDMRTQEHVSTLLKIISKLALLITTFRESRSDYEYAFHLPLEHNTSSLIDLVLTHLKHRIIKEQEFRSLLAAPDVTEPIAPLDKKTLIATQDKAHKNRMMLAQNISDGFFYSKSTKELDPYSKAYIPLSIIEAAVSKYQEEHENLLQPAPSL